jgi:hypothetical protein
MKTKLFITMALFAIIALAVIGCKQDATPTATPVPQSKTIGVGTGDGKLTINYSALPGNVPGYMSILEQAVKDMLPGSTANGKTLTINVISGDSVFTFVSSRTLNVGASWIANKTYDEMIESLGLVTTEWVK